VQRESHGTGEHCWSACHRYDGEGRIRIEFRRKQWHTRIKVKRARLMLSRGRGGELFGKVISAGTARQDVRAQGRYAATTPTEHPFELFTLRD
jgi:hypothetical protein